MIHGRVCTRLFSVLMAAVVLLSLLPASAAEERQVVRVAFPEQAGMSTVNGSGKLTGYNYDYLEKISEFTGWKMEYVFYPAEDGNEAVGSAIRDLVDGKVDLLGPMLKNEQTEQLYEYPENSYGTAYTTLCSDIGNPIRRSGLNGAATFRIGLWETAKTRNAEVMRFLSSENINYEIYYYPTSDAQQEALPSGEVDLISSLSLSPMVNTRIVAKFAARPYYFASTKGNTALIEQLDAAMAQIEALQPELQEHLFDAYFLEPVNAIYLTDAVFSTGMALVRSKHTESYENETLAIVQGLENAFAADARRCIAADMNAHLAKPLEMEKVKQAISEQARK